MTASEKQTEEQISQELLDALVNGYFAGADHAVTWKEVKHTFYEREIIKCETLASLSASKILAEREIAKDTMANRLVALRMDDNEKFMRMKQESAQKTAEQPFSEKVGEKQRNAIAQAIFEELGENEAIEYGEDKVLVPIIMGNFTIGWKKYEDIKAKYLGTKVKTPDKGGMR